MVVRKSLALWLVFAVLCWVSVGAFAEDDSFVYATEGESYVRSGPGLEYEKIAVIEEGASAAYIEEYRYDDRGVLWYKVECEDFDGEGREGWVSSRYTLIVDDSGSAKAYEFDAWVVTIEDAFLRSGPGLSYEKVGVLEANESRDYLSESAQDDRGVTWYKVEDYNPTGAAWISSAYGELLGDDFG